MVQMIFVFFILILHYFKRKLCKTVRRRLYYVGKLLPEFMERSKARTIPQAFLLF